MEDQDIIALYWAREEDAIRETAAKYGGLCRSIVGRILASPEDGEECLNDTWLGLWNAIPPQRPRRLAAFAGRVARNLALKRYDYVTARRRSPEAVRSLEELDRNPFSGGMLFYIFGIPESLSPEQLEESDWGDFVHITEVRYLLATAEKTYVLFHASDVQCTGETAELYARLEGSVRDIRIVVNNILA